MRNEPRLSMEAEIRARPTSLPAATRPSLCSRRLPRAGNTAGLRGGRVTDPFFHVIAEGEPGDFRSPSVSRAKCASNAVSFLVLGSADREFIIDIGDDRDVGVDPSRQAAAKLQPGDLA